MGLSYGGTELICPTAELCNWIEANLPGGAALPWLAPGHATAGNPALGPFDAPSRPMPGALRVGELYWPASSAQRWACGAFLADAQAAETIRTAANGDGTEAPTALALLMDDGRGAADDQLSLTMTLLRVVPLSAVPDDPDASPAVRAARNNLVLLVLVDARYQWQTTPCPDFAIGPYGSYADSSSSSSSSSGSTGDDDGGDDDGGGPPTWAGVIGQVADALGIELDLPEVDEGYLGPDPGWNQPGAPCGAMLDALLANVGLRLVAKYDGTFEVQGWQDAQAARAADDASDAGQARMLRAGGDQFADAL